MPNFQGTQAFTRQPGSTVQHDSDGQATQVIEWRGAKHKLTAFRSQVPSTSPDFSQLALAKPPDEINEGAYVRIRATYGGTSEEVSASYPIDVDDESPTIPVVTQTANFTLQTSTIAVNLDDWPVPIEFAVTYRSPINSVSYTQREKPPQVKGKSRSGISGEADPKILQVVSYTGFDADNHESLNGLSPLQLMRTDWSDSWDIRIIAKDFQRTNNGQLWRVTEHWTKEIYQANQVEDD